ncbi:hypothetical protein HDV00_000188 [Rhizophlyctis rosea]|nr:hypothetical protein HDV00_000188 [Rhizophlyctis rosea]
MTGHLILTDVPATTSAKQATKTTHANLRTAGYAVLHLLQLVTAAVFVWGINNQGQFGPAGVCLLYVRDYRVDSQGELIFSARSSVCPNSLGIGTAGIILALLLGTTSLSLRLRPPTNAQTHRSLLLLLTITSAFFAFLALGMAIFATDGLVKTCAQFQNLHPTSATGTQTSRTCADVFQTGFYDSLDPGTTYVRSLGVLEWAVGNCWGMGVLWTVFAGLMGWEWRNTSVKWW